MPETNQMRRFMVAIDILAFVTPGILFHGSVHNGQSSQEPYHGFHRIGRFTYLLALSGRFCYFRQAFDA